MTSCADTSIRTEPYDTNPSIFSCSSLLLSLLLLLSLSLSLSRCSIFENELYEKRDFSVDPKSDFFSVRIDPISKDTVVEFSDASGQGIGTWRKEEGGAGDGGLFGRAVAVVIRNKN